jgi:hypothetical protein
MNMRLVSNCVCVDKSGKNVTYYINSDEPSNATANPINQMKKNSLILGSALVIFTSALVPVKAATYGDSTGENFTTAGGGILDIASVEVNNTATDLIFKINLTGNPTATDWGKYLIGFDSTAGGATTTDGWARPISMSSGMDYWVGSWADSGNGAEVWKYTASWALQSATYAANPDSISIAKDSSSVTLDFKYAGLGLSTGSSFNFDIYTSGGGGSDSAVDALANPAQTISDWPNAYNSGESVFSYTIQAVPEPTSLALLGLGGAFAWMGLRRRA